jgi:uncharacterized protein
MKMPITRRSEPTRAHLWCAALLAGLALIFYAPFASAATPIPPAPSRWVTDTAGFLSPAVTGQLDARLAEVQRQSGHQVVVWIGRTLDGAALDDWAVRTFAAWKVGRKAQDDGLAVFLFSEDRTIDIEVGYGLEGQVSDAVASRIIREVMTPLLKAGDHDGAVTAGTEALLKAMGVAAVQPATSPPPPPKGTSGPSLPMLILYGLLGLGFLALLVTHPRFALFFVINLLTGGRGGGFGGGGGGFSGGGGSSGGGGARGSW